MPQAYIHKTNWTMQQAKDELDAAREQDAEQSARHGSTNPAAESRSAAGDKGQCPAFRCPVNAELKDNRSASLPASSSSSAGETVLLPGADVFGSGRMQEESRHAEPCEEQNSDMAQPKVQADASGGGGAAAEQPDQAMAAAAEGAGCPYIGFTMSSNFLDAQCLWDATMAYSIAQGLGQPLTSSQQNSSTTEQSSAGSALADGDVSVPSEAVLASSSAEGAAALQRSPLVLHVCGKFHSEGWMGIYEHIHAYHAANAKQQGSAAKRLDVVIVTFLPSSRDLTLTSEEFVEERLAAYGDYVVLTDFNRPRSFEVGHPL